MHKFTGVKLLAVWGLCLLFCLGVYATLAWVVWRVAGHA